MYAKYIFQLVLVLFTVSGYTGYSACKSDTIKPLPFSETWDSANFQQNSWHFPSSQGNWYIQTTLGNPPPSAVFGGNPVQTSYYYKLQSPWIDATDLSCDWLNLDFDVRLMSISNTGTEQLKVILEFGPNTRTLKILSNNQSFGWTHYHIDVTAAVGFHFRISIVASGQNSANIDKWLTDNISITRKCRPPRDLGYYPEHGACSYEQKTCRLELVWNPPDCSNLYSTSFSFDDGTFEEYLCPSVPGYLGNYFPVDFNTTGYITSIDVYCWIVSGYTLSLSIFDSTRSLIYTSQVFTVIDNYWTNVPVGNVTVSGPFYVMIHFDGIVAIGVGEDDNGPNASMDLAWSFINNTWTKVSVLGYGYGPGVFGIRTNALVPYKKAATQQEVYLESPDSSSISGYNIYRKRIWINPDTTFIKINQNPLSVTHYHDTIACQAQYYVTTVYNNNCESDPSNTIWANPCYVGVEESSPNPQLTITPNPASSSLKIHSELRIVSARLYDIRGVAVLFKESGMEKDLQLDVSALPQGMFFLQLTTSTTILTTKVLIKH